MSVWDVVGTGFDGGFVPMGKNKVGAGLEPAEETQRVERVWQVLNGWWKHLRPGQEVDEAEVREFSKKTFADLPIGEQSVVNLNLCSHSFCTKHGLLDHSSTGNCWKAKARATR